VAPLQRFAPGVQTPVQRPPVMSQMLVHMVGAPYFPSAPQCFDVFPSTQASVPGTHSPAHVPVAASQMNGHGVVRSSTQVPLSQVCGLPALHCFSFAVQARHSPPLHGELTQAVPSIQCPVALHVCTVLPEHRFEGPGTHSPPHLFVVASHTNVQATAVPHFPLASHVWTVFAEPLHRVVPGLHSPAQFPFTQAVEQGVSGKLVPEGSHT
jgi:hypothetical protein